MSLTDVLTALGIGGVAVYTFLRGVKADGDIAATDTRVTKALTELKVALIGIDGQNGMRSDVRAIREQVGHLGDRVSQHHDLLTAMTAKRKPVKPRRAA